MRSGRSRRRGFVGPQLDGCVSGWVFTAARWTGGFANPDFAGTTHRPDDQNDAMPPPLARATIWCDDCPDRRLSREASVPTGICPDRHRHHGHTRRGHGKVMADRRDCDTPGRLAVIRTGARSRFGPPTDSDAHRFTFARGSIPARRCPKAPGRPRAPAPTNAAQAERRMTRGRPWARWFAQASPARHPLRSTSGPGSSRCQSDFFEKGGSETPASVSCWPGVPQRNAVTSEGRAAISTLHKRRYIAAC